MLVARSAPSWATAVVGIGSWLCARMYCALIDWSTSGDVEPCLGDAFGEVVAAAASNATRYAIELTTIPITSNALSMCQHFSADLITHLVTNFTNH